MRSTSSRSERREPSTEPALHLTFDDGPDATWTPRVLQALRSEGARASFFMIGERVLAAPRLAQAVVEAGHDVQLHCHRHLRHSLMSEEEIAADAQAALQALRSAGADPALWRTPWGISTEASARVAARHGLELQRWSVDTHDWRGDSAAAMLEAVGAHIPAGGAVLMHDGLGPGSRRDGAQNTLEMISALTRRARDHGLMLTPMRTAAQRPEAFANVAGGALTGGRA